LPSVDFQSQPNNVHVHGYKEDITNQQKNALVIAETEIAATTQLITPLGTSWGYSHLRTGHASSILAVAHVVGALTVAVQSGAAGSGAGVTSSSDGSAAL